MKSVDELVDRIFSNIEVRVFLGKNWYLNPLNIKKKKSEMEALAKENEFTVFEAAFEDESSYLRLIAEFNEKFSGIVRMNVYDLRDNPYLVIEFSKNPEKVAEDFFQLASELNPLRSSSPDRLLVQPDGRRIWLDFYSLDGIYDSGSLYPRTGFRTHLYLQNISDFFPEMLKQYLRVQPTVYAE